MYLCAKLVGIATVVLSAGTVSPLVIPYLKNTNSWLFKKDFSKHGYDFQELDNTAEKRLEKLTHWLSKFSSASTTAKSLKEQEFEKMKPLFATIFQTEEEVKTLFDKIAKSLTEIVEKNDDLAKNSIKKLEQEKQKQLQQKLNEHYSTIKDTLKQWKASLNRVICAIDEKEDTEIGGKECKQLTSEIANFLESFSSLISSLMSLNSGGAQGGQQQADSKEGAEKAKAGLETVKKSLLPIIKDFNKQRGIYQVLSAYSKSKEQVATMLFAVFNTLVESLTKQIENLKKSIESDKESSLEKSKQIDETQKQLEDSYEGYLGLQRLESLFQWWGETFKEEVTKNQDDKARETVVSRRKK